MKLKQVILLTVIFVFMAVSLSFAEGVKLSDNVRTGMSKDEVKEQLDLDYHMSDKGLAAYQKGDKSIYYFFNKETNELIYKLMIMEDKKAEYKDKFKRMGDTIVDDKGAIFYSKNGSDFGIKIMDSDATDGEWQMWMGSIKLWNDYAEDRSFMNSFQK